MPQKLLRIGARGSKLAVLQAGLAARAIENRLGMACEIVTLKTSGDRIVDRPLADSGGKGLFVKELEEALLDGRIDLAVHSMKDVPAALPQPLEIAAILPREDPREALIMAQGKTMGDLSASIRIGTSSARRAAQVRRAWPHAEAALLRGNVDTRLAKLEAGAYDAILLAYAGLKRLGLDARATSLLPTESWLPALAQGAIGIEARKDDEAGRIAGAFADPTSFIAVFCERGFQAGLGGSCRSPIAGLASVSAGALDFSGEVIAPDGSDCVSARFKMEIGGRDFREAAIAAERRGREAGLSIRPRAAAWLDL
ncbi:MAG TPA: hydroxymethylbilane synthase [Rhizomicrobium sp.]|jgi:hydroxymethylbilane synthase|nr:hydroxymethylbilane synthase [Rhizomicrobium sp.]